MDYCKSLTSPCFWSGCVKPGRRLESQWPLDSWHTDGPPWVLSGGSSPWAGPQRCWREHTPAPDLRSAWPGGIQWWLKSLSSQYQEGPAMVMARTSGQGKKDWVAPKTQLINATAWCKTVVITGPQAMELPQTCIKLLNGSLGSILVMVPGYLWIVSTIKPQA